MVWTPGKGGSKASQDYYKKAKSEYSGRKPDKKEYKAPKKETKTGIPTKKEWYKENADPSQHKFVNENQRLIEKYAAKGKDFTKTEQYRQNMRYLDGVSVNRGGNRGRIYSNDPTLNSPSAEGNAYRRKLLAGEGPANRYALGKQGILNIDTDLARAGLEGTDHYFRFNQQLGEKNPKAYEEARPWASGAMLRNMAKMALPLPLKLLTNIAGAAGRGITNLIPKGMKEDLSWEGKKFMKSAKQFDPLSDLTTMLGLDETQKANMDIIQEEKDPNAVQKKIADKKQEELEIYKDRIMANTGEDLDDLAIAYDPTQDLLPETDENVHRNYWSEGYTLPLQEDPGFDEEYEETREDIFDKPVDPVLGVSQNRMPNVPITQEQKKKIVDQSGMLVPNYLETHPEDTDYLYNFVREQQEKGLEYKPGWEGVINKPTWDDPFVWQAPGHDELVDQIEWNTANRPLDWSGGATPELTEEFIQENYKSGSDHWDFNQGGYLKKYDDG